MKFFAVAALLAASLTFACGGDDDDSGTSGDNNNGGRATQATGGSTAASGGANSTPSTGGTGGGSSVAANTAVVTIGEHRYEFDLNGQYGECRSLLGGLRAVGESADGKAVSLIIGVPPLDASDEFFASIQVDDREKGVDWRAGDPQIQGANGVDAGDSQVDNYTIDDKRASGTATFLDMNAAMRGEIEPVKGTFEFACE